LGDSCRPTRGTPFHQLGNNDQAELPMAVAGHVHHGLQMVLTGKLKMDL
jgi:hypothetical protein